MRLFLFSAVLFSALAHALDCPPGNGYNFAPAPTQPLLTQVCFIRHDRPLYAAFFALLACFCFSLMAVCVRYIGAALPLEEVAFFRSIIPVIIVAAIMLYKRQAFFPPPRKPLVLRGVLGTGGLVCFFHATQHLPLSVSGILVWCTPVVTYITARVVLRERLGWTTLLWMLVALAGLMLIFAPVVLADLHASAALAQVNLADFSIGLMGTLFAGLVFVTIRSAAATHNNNSIVMAFSVTAALMTGIWSAFNFVQPSPLFYAILIGMGVTGTAAQMALTEAYRNAPAALVSSMSLMQAPFTIFWGVFMFAENLTFLHIFGIVLMGLGVGMASRAHASDTRAAKAE